MTSPIPPHIKKSYQAEEDNGEFVVVVPGDGDGADEYDDRDDKAEDGGDDRKPAAPPPSSGGIRIGRHDDEDDSNEDSDCEPTAKNRRR